MLWIYVNCVSPEGSGDILFFPVHSSVHHKSCPLYNSKTVKNIAMKLDTLTEHDKTM